jgi:hypothetical protein
LQEKYVGTFWFNTQFSNEAAVSAWKDEANARVLRSSTEIRAALDAGELEQFNGTPDTHPNGFVVNCPAAVLAPNDFGAT